MSMLLWNRNRQIKTWGQITLVTISILFTTYQFVIKHEPFFNIDFFLFTILAWIVGWRYDLSKYYEKKAKDSEESYRLLMDSLPESIFIQSLRENKLVYVNHAAVKMMGASSGQELINRSFGEFVTADYMERWKMRLNIALEKKKPLSPIEYKMKRVAGNDFFYEASCLAIMLNGEDVILSIGKDITASKEKTMHLLQKSEKLAILGEMSAGIAHEIRNPLTSIKGFIQLAKAENPKNRYFEIVLSEIERINGIVGELLFLAKPTADVFLVKDIRNIIKDVITLIHTQLSLHNIQIKEVYEWDIPMILCEEKRLKQVFINLLQNAIEAMPQGGYISIKGTSLQDGNISIEIMDQGVGIPDERLGTLGEPFFTTKEKGTGLGLMTCFKIIESHNGSLSFQSELNKGTKAIIVFPAATQDTLLGTVSQG
ncbi:ATP-binding protein [Niallia circulans]|jgi:PAS domain S-box-containing protein|uniref:ATP-binding protein n=2 Tax=Bacillaceae TaxID=186817 RepID=UPI001FD1E8B7|nr:ATP-binding protein [Niallia circulans]MED3838434.1 ATP-binding protein [Niallia circulans]